MARDRFDRLYQLVGDRICKGRAALGLSQAALAGRIGVNRVSIVNIEKGRQRPPLDLLWRIAEALEVDVSQLIPRPKDFEAAADGIQLDDSTVAQIEKATKGDPSAARQLEAFIKMAKSRNAEQ